MSTITAVTFRSRLVRLWLGLILVGSGICLAIPISAQATPARFTVEYCDSALPGGNPPVFEASAQSPGYAVVQTCASPGGVLGISVPGVVTDFHAFVIIPIILATPGGFIEDETISGYVSNLQPWNRPSIFTKGWPVSGGGDTARKFILGEESPLGFGVTTKDYGGRFYIVMGCGQEICNGSGIVAAHYIAVTQIDPNSPEIPEVEGSLLSGEVQRGHQSLTALAGDTGGGVSRVEVLVNGLPAASPSPGACAVARVSNSSYQGLAATSPTPCPPWMSASWLLDTAGFPFHDGTNTVQVCASDLATVGSPNTTCSAVQTVNVNNSCAESEVPGGQVLSAHFAATNSETVTVPYGKPAEVTGGLVNNAGDPISGATICVQAQTEGEPGGPGPIATATTDANGQFTYQVPAGPNRNLLIGYRHDAVQLGRTISYASHTKPTLELSRGRVHAGDRIGITGALPGPAASGRVVVLQASALHGRRWLTFRRATTGPRGGFSATYRFGSTSSTITYRIRAVVPQQSGYPYAAGHSTPALVKVHVRGQHNHSRRHHKKKGHVQSDRRGDLELMRDQGKMSERIRIQVQTDDQARRTR